MTNKELIKMPDSLELWTMKGEILSDMERFDEAIHAYDKILELNPDSPEVWANKSLAFLAMEHPEDSLHAANKAVECGLDESGVQLTKVGSLLQLERYDEAMGVIESLLRENPKDAYVLDLRAETFSGMGKHDEAIVQLEELSDLDPWSVDMLVSLSGEHILAERFFKSAESCRQGHNSRRKQSHGVGKQSRSIVRAWEVRRGSGVHSKGPEHGSCRR